MGLSTGRSFTYGEPEPRIMKWGNDVHLILASTPSLKRPTFQMEGEREDAHEWTRLLFQEFHDKLSRLEQVSCVIAGPDMSTSLTSLRKTRVVSRSGLTRMIELGVIGPRMTFGSSYQFLHFVAGLERTFAIERSICLSSLIVGGWRDG